MTTLTSPPSATACEHCGAPLGDDQRYCLACGAASPAARAAPARSAAAPAPPAAEPSPVARDLTPVLALGGLLALAVVLIAGVLIGRSGSHPATAAAPIVRVTGGSGSGGATSGGDTASSASSVATDWPHGATGWTVELGRVPKAGADAASVAAAKSAAAKKGAPKVGVLDSDSYGSLPGGDYVIYSGRYASKAKASAALKKLKKKYPSAKVVHVTAGGSGGGKSSGGGGSGGGGAASGAKAKQAIQDLNKSGGAYEQQLKKKPKTIAVPGKAPPKDHKAPGGGSGAESIG